MAELHAAYTRGTRGTRIHAADPDSPTNRTNDPAVYAEALCRYTVAVSPEPWSQAPAALTCRECRAKARRR